MFTCQICSFEAIFLTKASKRATANHTLSLPKLYRSSIVGKFLEIVKTPFRMFQDTLGSLKTLISILAACNHSPKAQESLVSDMKASLLSIANSSLSSSAICTKVSFSFFFFEI